MARSDDTRPSVTTQRLPSQRPIDQRWDRPRAVIFQKIKGNALRDLRWSRGDGIAFVGTPAATRAYASKPKDYKDYLGSVKRNAPASNSQKAVKDSSTDAMHNPYNTSSTDVTRRDVLHEVAREESRRKLIEGELDSERQARRENENRLNAQIDDLRHQMQKQKATDANAKQEVEEDLKREQQISARLRGSEESKSRQLQAVQSEQVDLQKRTLERTRAVEGREAQVQTREDSATIKEDALDSIIEEGQQEAKRAAREELEDVRSAAEEAQQRAIHEATRHQEQYYRDVENLKQEYSRSVEGWHKHDSDVDTRVTKRYGDALRLAREAAVGRSQERIDYAAYRQIWDDIRRPTRDLGRALDDVILALSKTASTWKRAEEDFKGSAIHTWFPHRYARLHRRIKDFLLSGYEHATKQVESFRLLKSRRQESQRQLYFAGHDSRELTRYHRFGNKPHAYGTVAIANKFCNVKPFEVEKDKLDEELDQMSTILREGSIQAAKRSLVQKILRVQQARGDMEASKAMLGASPMEQERYYLMTNAKRLAGQANAEWEKVVKDNPNPTSEAASGRETQIRDRREYKELHSANSRELDYVEVEIQKRQLLEIHLGVHQADGKWGPRLERQVRDGEITFSALLGELVGARDHVRQLSRQSSGSRLRRLVPPPAPRSVEASPRPRISSTERMADLKAKLQQPDAYANGKAKRKDKQELSDARLAKKRHDLASLQGHKKRLALSRSTDDLRRLHEVERNIASLQSQLSEPEQVSRSPSQPKTVLRYYHGKTNESRERSTGTAKATRSVSGRLRRQRAADLKTMGSNNESKGKSVGVLTFKPTASKLAPHAYAASQCFHVHAILSVPEPDLSPTAANDTYDSTCTAAVLPSDSRFLPTPDPARSYESLEQAMSSMKLDTPSSQERSSSSQAESDGSYQPSQASQVSSGSGNDNALDPSSEPTSSQASTSTMQSDDSVVTAPETQQVDTIDTGTQLTYQIPAEDYRNAVLASKSTNAAYWSHKLYKNAEGQKPSVYYCTNREQTEARAKEFLNESIIGFDIEWEMGAQPGKASIKRNVSLIQIASEDKIALFQVATFKGETIDELMPPSLRAILESPTIAKAGVNIQGDARRLQECLNVTMTGLFELSHLYRVVMFSESTLKNVNRKPFKMADQVQNVLLLPLKKDDVRVSAWSKRLNVEQTDYAAADAYAGFRLYHALEAKRKTMSPMPPRPAYYEEHQPLQLGDGTLIIAKTYVSKQKQEATDNAGKAAEDEEDESEEYFDAVESLDAIELDSSQSAGVPMAGLNVTYPTLPTLDPTQGVEEATDPHVASSSSTKPTAKRTGPPPSPEIDQADQWVIEWKAALPAEYNLKVNTASLRAYHLWHKQSLSCPQVAALLRDPPLQLQTVASYVLQALKEEDLAFDAARVHEPMGIIPASVRGRYQKVLNKMET